MIEVAGAYIERDGKFLVAQRAKGSLSGKWEFPGGKLEPNETAGEAIIREIREELSLDVVPKEIVGIFVHQYSKGEIRLTLIKCEMDPKQSIVSDGSHSECRWIDITECDEFDFAALDVQIVEMFKKQSLP